MTAEDRQAALARNIASTGHDLTDPASTLNHLEAVWLASDSTVPRCQHCTEERHMLPMPGNGWAFEIVHEPHCPEHEDNQPGPTREEMQS